MATDYAVDLVGVGHKPLTYNWYYKFLEGQAAEVPRSPPVIIYTLIERGTGRVRIHGEKELRVLTAAHVVFDDSEAKKTRLVLFDDNDDGNPWSVVWAQGALGSTGGTPGRLIWEKSPRRLR